MSKLIGIVGGMGPYAALDVNKKLLDNTQAELDKDHLNVVLLSLCEAISGRTKFLLGETLINPAEELAQKVAAFNLDVIGVACHTFHVPAIFDVFEAKIKETNPNIELLHFPQEVKKATLAQFPKATTIGVLCTIGTYELGLYQDIFKETSIQLQFPDEAGRKAVHDAILHQEWGIKPLGQLSSRTQQVLETEIAKFQGVDAILLACTELPLVISEIHSDIPLIDSNEILARRLIEIVNPSKLKKA